ncbi:MAG TPA: glycosyltransferase family 2 protein [Clostridia bacterium]|nr:glycosyltransferase family 2 protein [Clostridia bacterium]HRX41850.1 glycosyltransferase family 2 protein [Clostridia bacterium]
MNNENYLLNMDFFEKYSSITSVRIRKSSLENPLFAVAIPTYGRAELLKEAIYSCIGQSFREPFKIIVVDNDPVRNNETEQLIESITDERLEYYKNSENIGCLGNFNRCIELTDSEYMIMLHTDDVLSADYLEKLVPVIRRNPGIDMLIPGKRIIRNNSSERHKGYSALAGYTGLRHKGVRLNVMDFCMYNITGGPLGIIMRRSMCIELGGFNESLFPMSDYSFWVRAALQYNVVLLPMLLGDYRFIDNISSGDGMQLGYITNEFKLIGSIIEDMKNKRSMQIYLNEYIRYRLRKSKLYSHERFVSITNESRVSGFWKKPVYYGVILKMAFSYIRRALSSDIKA